MGRFPNVAIGVYVSCVSGAKGAKGADRIITKIHTLMLPCLGAHQMLCYAV